jgi:hypothetical protein
MSKPILVLDFDGVCHSYTSGWKGADVISDPPVEGLWHFLNDAVKVFEVNIFSSRSNQAGGIEAMKVWFAHEGDVVPGIVAELRFPTEKPPAMITLDDRGILFEGTWPSVEKLKSFQPWYLRKKGGPNMQPHQERVVAEMKELDEKIVKLDTFRHSPLYETLPDAERDRLTRQYAHMKDYSNVLAERIVAFDVPQS